MKANSYFDSFLGKFGFLGFVRIAAYPITSIITNPLMLFRTLQSLLVLAEGQWSKFSRLNAYVGFNTHWHRGYDLYVEKYGSKGYCFDISIGRPLESLFQITKLSVRFYRYNDTITPILGMFIFWVNLSFFYSLENVSLSFLVAIMLITLFSSVFYYCTFEAMKYDVFGWALVPLLFLGVFSGNLWLCTVVLMAIAILSVSVIVPISLVFVVMSFFLKPLLMLAVLPAAFKVAMHFMFLLKNFHLLNATAHGVGFSNKGRKVRKMKFGLEGWFYTLLWSSFLLVIYFFGGDNVVFPKHAQAALILTAIFIHVVNQRFLRFTDDYNAIFLGTCSLIVVTIFQNNFVFLPFLWLTISPPPMFLSFAGESWLTRIDRLPLRKPFVVKTAYDKLVSFFSSLPLYERVLFYYKYDANDYPDYEGYRSVLELVRYIGAERDFLLFPDYYAIFDTYAGKINTEQVYGDHSPVAILHGLQLYGGNFVILPHDSQSPPEDWLTAGYVLINTLKLSDLVKEDDCGANFYPQSRPYWHLLKSPQKGSICEGGEIVSIEPNKIEIRLSKGDSALIKFIYDRRWMTNQAAVSLDESTGFIRVHGKASMNVTLNFIN